MIVDYIKPERFEAACSATKTERQVAVDVEGLAQFCSIHRTDLFQDVVMVASSHMSQGHNWNGIFVV